LHALKLCVAAVPTSSTHCVALSYHLTNWANWDWSWCMLAGDSTSSKLEASVVL